MVKEGEGAKGSIWEGITIMKATLFDRCGGFATVHKLVLSFYDKVLDSDIMGPYFEDVDMPRLIDHQTKFMSQVMGGPTTYTNQVLEQLHRHLKIDQASFDEMTDILEQTLREFEFSETDVSYIMSDIKSRQPYIVTAT